MSKKFYGGFIKFCRFCANFFAPKGKYRADFKEPEEPVVYVCRHLNMHGPLTVLRSSKVEVRAMVLNVFFDKKTAREHYLNVTFKNKRCKKLLAFFAGTFVPKMVNSGGFIPVYRGDDKRSFLTVKRAFERLSAGECVAVFPDKNYKAGYDEKSDIYSGFLVLEKLYFKKFEKHLKFVPLLIDDGRREIIEKPPICFSGEEDFKEESEQIKQKIIEEINEFV